MCREQQEGDYTMMNRPSQAFKTKQEVFSPYHDVQGIVEAIDWSVSFGQWTYKIERVRDGRHDQINQFWMWNPELPCVWICESDLIHVPPEGTATYFISYIDDDDKYVYIYMDAPSEEAAYTTLEERGAWGPIALPWRFHEATQYAYIRGLRRIT